MESAAFWLLVLTLAWAPFPLGSNRPWSWSLLSLLVALSWCLWLLSDGVSRVSGQMIRRLALPILFTLAALAWGCLQMMPGLSSGATSFLWMQAGDALGRELSPALSLDPWRTGTEVMKLATYAMAAWLTLALCRHPQRAKRMLSLLITIGALYAVYALTLDVRGEVQFEFFYAGVPIGNEGAGPFVNRNSYATFAGLVLVCSIARLVDVASWSIVVSQGIRQFLLTLAQFFVGAGMGAVLTFFLALSTLIACGSRAGFVSAAVGLCFLFLFAAFIAAKRISLLQGAAALSVLLIAIFGVVLTSGDSLVAGLERLAETGGALELRGVLWDASARMIGDAPLTGFGLGSYEYVYPFYAQEHFRVTMDKAHNDYLELAAGIGLPAALLWWAAMAWAVGLCVQAVFVRRHDRVYPLIALGATALVGFHSIFDFSLQIPAIALMYAVILGLGVAQSFSSRAA